MADTKISALTAADAAAGANEIPINEAGTTKKVTVTQIATAILPVKATGAEINTGTDDAKFATAKALADSVLRNLPEGGMINGKIVPSVASNNLTVALKGLDGNDPSATNPVYIIIGGTLRSVTAALSITKNAGTNWCNAGSAELATKEIDYFVYLGYNATDGVVIGFSRIPYATLYSEFSATATNEKFCSISTITNAAAGDNYVNIGRFAATLSAGAGYTWSVPTFTASNLIQRPIYETRLLTWQPVYSASGSMTFSTVTTTNATYKLIGRQNIFLDLFATGTTGGTASTGIIVTPPISTIAGRTAAYVFDTARTGILFASTTNFVFSKDDISNFALASGKEVAFVGIWRY